jgi:LPXTG-motif cell wall-anchored protein
MRVSRDTASDGTPWAVIGGIVVIAGILVIIVRQRRTHSTNNAPRDAEERSTESTQS